MLTVSTARFRPRKPVLELTGAYAKVAPNTGGLGEPLNVIISGNSDDLVLVDSEDNGGFRNYFL